MKRSAAHAFLFTVTKISIAFLLICTSLHSTTAQCECADSCNIPVPYTSKVSMTVGGYWRVINSNGIPDHPIGIFPLIGCGRPTAIKEQDYTFVIPAYSSRGMRWRESEIFELPAPPFIRTSETVFGVAVNGVPFDPAAAEWWDPGEKIWDKNPILHPEMATDLDCNNGHVQPDGGYHYHGFPTKLFDRLRHEQANDPRSTHRSEIVLLGWAFDGNPIYAGACGLNNKSIVRPNSGYILRTDRRIDYYTDDPLSVPRLTDWDRGVFTDDFIYDTSLTPGTDQLDECNGHTAPTPEFHDPEHPDRHVYHYHILSQPTSSVEGGYPYIGRCYRLFKYWRGPDIFPRK